MSVSSCCFCCFSGAVFLAKELCVKQIMLLTLRMQHLMSAVRTNAKVTNVFNSLLFFKLLFYFVGVIQKKLVNTFFFFFSRRNFQLNSSQCMQFQYHSNTKVIAQHCSDFVVHVILFRERHIGIKRHFRIVRRPRLGFRIQPRYKAPGDLQAKLENALRLTSGE